MNENIEGVRFKHDPTASGGKDWKTVSQANPTAHIAGAPPADG
jgi:hypothetical protein